MTGKRKSKRRKSAAAAASAQEEKHARWYPSLSTCHGDIDIIDGIAGRHVPDRMVFVAGPIGDNTRPLI